MAKIPLTTKNKIVEVISAIMEPDASGINIRAKNERGELEGYFVPAEVWGRIPPNKHPAIELEKIARILNGYKETPVNEWEPVPNFQPKKINIEIES